MERVFTSWSGGKDSCWACYLASRRGLQVCRLLNMANEDGSRSWIHAIRPELMALQAEAVAVPVFQGKSGMDTYETDFRETMRSLKQQGISGGVFGDIDLEDNRRWVTGHCRHEGITPHFPLWGQSQEEILREFVAAGFEAVVVVAEDERLGEEWLGRTIDSDFIAEVGRLKETSGLRPAGEAGEYHTFVIDGPIFKQRIEITGSQAVFRKGYWFLDILTAELRAR